MASEPAIRGTWLPGVVFSPTVGTAAFTGNRSSATGRPRVFCVVGNAFFFWPTLKTLMSSNFELCNEFPLQHPGHVGTTGIGKS